MPSLAVDFAANCHETNRVEHSLLLDARALSLGTISPRRQGQPPVERTEFHTLSIMSGRCSVPCDHPGCEASVSVASERIEGRPVRWRTAILTRAYVSGSPV